jgi:nitroreductase
MDVAEAIRTRRSVKSFTTRPVERREIEALLELAVHAPNHRMTQPWRFVVMGPQARRAYGRIKGSERAARVDDTEVARAVRRKTEKEMAALPAMVAFLQPLDSDEAIREEDYATVYMGIQNVLLGAVAMGLGTHVKTGAVLDDSATRDLLGAEEGERVVALVQLGEPQELPGPRPRDPADERTRWLD